MSNELIVFALITFLHDLFTVVWIGGLITLGLITLPSVRKVLGEGSQTQALVDAIQRRQSVWVYISIVGLLVTGMLQARGNPAFQGLFSVGNAYSIALTLKHIFVIVMIAIALYRSLAFGRRREPMSPSQTKQSARLLLLNIILGVVVLLVSGFLVAFASTMPV